MFNPPSAIRSALYVLSVFINATLAVLISSDVELSVYILAVVAGFNAVVALMARSNVSEE